MDVKLERENIWLSLTQMAALFERDKSVASPYLRNIYRTNELERKSVSGDEATALLRVVGEYKQGAYPRRQQGEQARHVAQAFNVCQISYISLENGGDVAAKPRPLSLLRFALDGHEKAAHQEHIN